MVVATTFALEGSAAGAAQWQEGIELPQAVPGSGGLLPARSGLRHGRRRAGSPSLLPSAVFGTAALVAAPHTNTSADNQQDACALRCANHATPCHRCAAGGLTLTAGVGYLPFILAVYDTLLGEEKVRWAAPALLGQRGVNTAMRDPGVHVA